MGIGVLDASGNPVDATNTFHRIDLTGNNDLDVFAESDKVFHDPNTYNWKAGSVPQKDDIQNGLIHISVHPITGDLWVVMAGDRRAENGDSYIDFEFLQNTLTKNFDGTFTSLGPDGGRTVGDILLTIELTKGGGQASFFVQRWLSDGSGGFTYVDFTPAAGTAFVAANIDSVVTIPYSPFSYEVNAFGEAAANLTALISSLDPCFGAKTIWIRTKSSQSPTAQLKDMTEPIQLNICLDHQAPVITCPGDKIFDCVMGDAGTATATDNCAVASITPSDEILSGKCPRIIKRTWTALDKCGNSASCVQMITIQDTTKPVISCPTDKVFDCVLGNAGQATATDNCGAVSVSSSDQIFNSRCPLVIKRTWTATDTCGNSSSCVQTITVQDTTKPVVTCPPNKVFDCVMGDAGAATATDNCGAVNVSSSDVITNVRCPLVIARTWTATDTCGNSSSCVQTITVQDTTKPVVTCPPNKVFDCVMGDAGTTTATDNCGPGAIKSLTSNDVITNARCPLVIERTWTVTDTCGNSSSCVQTITVQDTTKPTITCQTGKIVACKDAISFDQPSASDNCDPSPAIVIVSTNVTPGPGAGETTYTRTWNATDSCGNVSATCSQSIIREACPSECPGTFSSIASGFNGTAIAAGRYIWFNAVFKVNSSLGSSPVTIQLSNSSIQFTANGTPYNLTVPDADITFDPSASCATTTFNGVKWVTTVPSSMSGNNSFLSGLAFPVPVNFPGGISPVTWSGTFSSSVPNISLDWKWAAAVYTSFSTNYNTLGVKPVDGSGACLYANADHAGTPENFKSFVTGGARGGGGSNFTGSYSATNRVVTCPTVSSVLLQQVEKGLVDAPTAAADGTIPTEFALHANYPNPFNANTTIKYSLPNDGKVTILVYNILGQRVITLVDGEKPAGEHTVIWDGKNASGNSVASGVYFYRIQFGNQTQIKRMTLLK